MGTPNNPRNNKMLGRRAVFGLILCIPSVIKAVNTFPNPNTCHISHEQSKRFDWGSKDCPRYTVCAPHNRCAVDSPNINASMNTAGICSCLYTEYMLERQSDGECTLSVSSYVYAAYWLLLGLVGFAVVAYNTHTFWLALHHHIFELDTFFISAISSLFASIFHVIQCAQFAHSMISTIHMSATVEKRWYTATVLGDALYAACVIMASLVFGLTAYSTFFNALRFRKIDRQHMRKQIAKVTLFFGVALGVGGVVLLQAQQFSLVFAYFALFTFVIWLLFRRVLKYVARLAQAGQPKSGSQPFRSPTASLSTTDIERELTSLPSDSLPSFELPVSRPNPPLATLGEMATVSTRVVRSMFGFVILSLLYNVLWYTGRARCSTILLGPICATVNGSSFASVLFGLASFALYKHRVVEIRIRVKPKLNTTIRVAATAILC